MRYSLSHIFHFQQKEKHEQGPSFFLLGIMPLSLQLLCFRLTPVYAFVIFYYATVFDHVGTGPMWKMVVSPEVQDCRNNWYLNLLYISNYVRDDHMVIKRFISRRDIIQRETTGGDKRKEKMI